jgi:hypothetical protein
MSRTIERLWENALYRFFTHHTFYTESRAPSIFLINGREQYLSIFPTDEAIEEIIDFAENMGCEMKEFSRQFELELYSNMDKFDSAIDRFQFISGVCYKFQDITDRRQAYKRMSSELKDFTTNFNAAQDPPPDPTGVLALRVYFLRELLEETSEILNKLLNASKRIVQDATSLTIQEVESKENVKQIEKLRWLCTDSVAAFILTELIDKQYLETPLHNGERSYSKSAKIFSQYFEFKTTSGEYLETCFNPNRLKLSEVKKEKLKLPYADQVT